MAASSSVLHNSPFLRENPIQEEVTQNQESQQQQQSILQSDQAPRTRKRRLPGTPKENAEVVALSPEELLATHKFECKECHMGFQRDQNLQLHLRKHKKSWKLAKRDSRVGPPRRKVYVCPEPGCVHNDPARALGDITGVKKHYSRKHCACRFPCRDCGHVYAVEGDLKAHSKTCRARFLTCCCGASFKKEEDLTTHQSLCDAFKESTIHASLSNTSNTCIEGAMTELSPSLNASNAMTNSEVPPSSSNVTMPSFSLTPFASLNINSDEILDITTHGSTFMATSADVYTSGACIEDSSNQQPQILYKPAMTRFGGARCVRPLNNSDALCEGPRPTFSLNNFAPLNTNSHAFLDSPTHASALKRSTSINITPEVYTFDACFEGIINQESSQCDPRVARSRGVSYTLPLNNSGALCEGLSPFSLNNFAPLNTNSPTFLDSTTPIPTLNDYISSLSPFDNHLYQVSKSQQSKKDSNYINFNVAGILSLSEDHPMMLSTTSSMIHPPHELSMGDGVLTTMNSSTHEFGAGNVFDEDVNGTSNTLSFSNLLLSAQLDKDETGVFGDHEGGLNYNGGSNIYQYNGCNKSLSTLPSTTFFGEPNKCNYIVGNPSNGGEGSSSSTTTLFGFDISIGKAIGDDGQTRDFLGVGSREANENC